VESYELTFVYFLWHCFQHSVAKCVCKTAVSFVNDMGKI
jgi:hypothetical protein